MNNVEFLSFIKTPQEKHVGIATIRVDRRFIFRFKVSQNPKGEGFFCNEPAVKGIEYEDAFQFDSSYEEKEVKKFILSHVKQALQEKVQPFSNSYQQMPEEAPQQFEFDPIQF